MRIPGAVWLVGMLAVAIGLVGGLPAVAQICTLDVNVSAQPSFTRMYCWSIDKTCCPTELTLSKTQTAVVNYTVTCDGVFTDSEFAVGGNITLTNNTSSAVTLGGVAVIVAPDIAATVNCGVTFPYELAGGGSRLVCSYSAALPDATMRNVNVTVLEDGESCFYQTLADFSTATVTEIDECVDVVDSWQGYLGTACASEIPVTFTYCREIGPVCVCGDWPVTNTVHFTTNDTLTTGCDSCTVYVHIPCYCGCTRTPGYWKTHSELGPAPYDATWAQLANGANTSFFLSGKTYYQVLWTPRRGNAYYILAFQYIAAELNALAGASVPPEVSAAFVEATAVFQTYTPAQVGCNSGGVSRDQLLMLADILGDYNEGYLGPGHCPD